MGSGRDWLAGDWPWTGGVLNITAAAWTAGFQWWRSGDITRTQNVREYMHILDLCLVIVIIIGTGLQPDIGMLFLALHVFISVHNITVLHQSHYT